MSSQQSTVKDMISSLKRQRDELKLQVHLGSADAKEEWERLDEKFQGLVSRFEPLKQAVDETTEDVWESLKLVAGEVTDGFHRIRKSL